MEISLSWLCGSDRMVYVLFCELERLMFQTWIFFYLLISSVFLSLLCLVSFKRGFNFSVASFISVGSKCPVNLGYRQFLGVGSGCLRQARRVCALKSSSSCVTSLLLSVPLKLLFVICIPLHWAQTTVMVTDLILSAMVPWAKTA